MEFAAVATYALQCTSTEPQLAPLINTLATAQYLQVGLATYDCPGSVIVYKPSVAQILEGRASQTVRAYRNKQAPCCVLQTKTVHCKTLFNGKSC